MVKSQSKRLFVLSNTLLRQSCTVLFKKSLVAMAIFTLSASLSLTAQGNTPTPLAPNEIITDTTKVLTTRLKKITKEERKIPLTYETIVREVLVPIIDFNTFTKLMMGKKVYQSSSPEQIEKFTHTFSENLIKTYSIGLSLYTNEGIEVYEFDPSTDIKGNKAKVKADLITADRRIPVSFSFRRNKSEEWKVINITLMGINIGTVFKGMFQEILERNNNDMTLVLANWDKEINKSVSGVLDSVGVDENVDSLTKRANENLKKCGSAICEGDTLEVNGSEAKYEDGKVKYKGGETKVK